MPSTIRIQVDRVTADLAAHRLEEEGIPVQVVSDGDWVAVAGVPRDFSLVVPTQYERRARKILSEVTPQRRRPR